jgi:hypothetical protein
LAGTSLMLLGCGAETYDYRLKETKKYFEYLDKVNAALGPKTTLLEGIEIRVPKPFEQLVLPAPPAEGQPEEPPPPPSEDPTRLGYHPNVRLEGIVATWKATVRVEASGQRDWGEANAYLHLVSNLSRWDEKQTNVDIDPLRYLDDLTTVLANAYNVQAETIDSPWPWELIRGFSPYVGKKKIETLPIPPEDQPINAVMYRLVEGKDVQFALLLIYPRNIDPGLRLEDRMKHTLEWLKVPTQPPKAKTNKPVAPSLF